jgi:hypothetical protein
MERRCNQVVSKPVRDILISTPDEKSAEVKAVFDTGSFYTILRADRVPSSAAIVKRKHPLSPRAADGSKLAAVGEVSLVPVIGKHRIIDMALVSPDLAQEMIVGAGTMQKWGISVLNRNGHTEVRVGLDMRDPDVVEVD